MKFTLQINRHIHTQTHSLNSRRIVFLLFTFLFIVCCSYSLCMCVYFHESFYFFVLFILFFFSFCAFCFCFNTHRCFYNNILLIFLSQFKVYRAHFSLLFFIHFIPFHMCILDMYMQAYINTDVCECECEHTTH